MRIFITVLFLIFSFQSLIKADDIRDFEIEGMSIGDSALDYFTLEHILKEFEIGKDEYSHTDQKFADVYKYGGMDLYDNLNVAVKRKDSKYIIYTVTGQITYKNINDCLKQQKEIVNNFTKSLQNFKKDKWVEKHPRDNTGKSKIHWVIFENKNNDKIEVVCFDLAKHLKQPSGLDVGIISAEYRNWLQGYN